MSGKWTAEDIPDLSGKVIIVTGANTGLGYVAAREFSKKGAEVIMACRNLERGQAALDRIAAESARSNLRLMHLDLASLRSVRSFSEEFKAVHDRLDVLLNNAGIMMVPYGRTEDGFEMHLGVNHLGHFALTGLLSDVWLKTPRSRVVTVSSMAHRFGKMDFDDLMFERGGYGPMRAYARSKLANLLFTYELQRRLEQAGSDSLALAAHPGVADTELGRYAQGSPLYRLISHLITPQGAEMGALPEIRASVDPNAKGGEFYGPGGWLGARGYPVLSKSSHRSRSKADARRLWHLSEELTGVRWMSE
ncbi:MAG: oxidoreductase [Thermoplasmata archaeon]